jgi:NhaA family Na+:H+ antiporter
VPLGIAAGLFVGKQVGIFGACWLAIKLGLAKLPEGATWMQFYAVTILCGIGFTMSLFIGSLAFEAQGAEYMIDVKLGVLVGSLLSAVAGSILISWSQKSKNPNGEVE